MIKFVIRRALQAIPVLFGITIVVYGILLAAPGGPTAKFANNPQDDRGAEGQVQAAWGLDQPIPIQYCRWMGFCNPETEGTILGSLPTPAAFIGPTGLPELPADRPERRHATACSTATSATRSTPARRSSDRIARAALPTFILASVALVVWLLDRDRARRLRGDPPLLAVRQRARRCSRTSASRCPRSGSGIMLIFIFAGTLHMAAGERDDGHARFAAVRLATSTGRTSASNPLPAIGDIGKHLILPVITLVVVNIAGDSRFVRASMLESLGQDYVRTAKAKGLPARVVNFKHALRNALLPVITNIGLEIPFLFTGAIVTETIFSWPGIGKLTIDATREFDYPILMGVLLVTSVLVVFANLIADVAYGVVDPRIKY